MKRKLLRNLLVSILLASWLFSGWPPIWPLGQLGVNTIRIPPEIKQVRADGATKTYTFDADLESWTATACGASGATCIWQSGDGSPAAGSLEEPETRKNKGGTWTWQLSGITWESLGISSGATVTAVDGSYNHTMATCTDCNTTGSNTSGALSIRDSADTATIATLETAVSYAGAAAWTSRDASGAQSIGASYQASNTGIILRLSGGIQTNNVTGAQAVIRQDQISLAITYTPAAQVYSVAITPEGTISYGTVEVGQSKSTIDLSATRTATNDGNTTENLNIKTSNATGGTGWTLGETAGTNIFVHEFSTNGGGAWTKFTAADSYQTLATGVAQSGTQDFDLRVTAPSDSDTVEKTITITVQAVSP